MQPSTTLRITLWAALGLAACSEPYETTTCLSLPEDGVCPVAEDVLDQLLGEECGRRVIAASGEGTITAPDWLADTDVVEDVDLLCCYDATARSLNDGCVVGRPLWVDGTLSTAPAAPHGAWSSSLQPDVRGLDQATRAQLAQAWLRTAAGEHASVAAFSRLSLELMRLGAPPELLSDVHEAARDEIRHAQAAYSLASAYAGTDLGPGALPLPDRLPLASTVEALARAVAAEGCRDETLAALLAAEAAASATDPAVRQVLEGVARDEARHAALSWRILKWCLEAAPEVTSEVAAILSAPPRRASVPEPDAAILRDHGVLGERATWQCHVRGTRDVVQATWSALQSERPLVAVA